MVGMAVARLTPLNIEQGLVLISLEQRIGYEPSQTPMLYYNIA